MAYRIFKFDGSKLVPYNSTKFQNRDEAEYVASKLREKYDIDLVVDCR